MTDAHRNYPKATADDQSTYKFGEQGSKTEYAKKVRSDLLLLISSSHVLS